MTDAWRALAPLGVLIGAFEIWCLVLVVREEPRLLPRWAWLLVCLVSIPLGGIVYLLVGRGDGIVAATAESGSSAVATPGLASPASGAIGCVDTTGPVARTSARVDKAAVAAPIVVTAGLSKRYGDRMVLDAVDLEVPEGSVFGLVGPNGAGKTTLLSILAGLRSPSAGTADVGAGQRSVAYLPDTPSFEPWLTAREVVDLARSLARRRDAQPRDRLVLRSMTAEALERTGLADAADRRTGGFSRGMLQRLGLAVTLVGRPDLLLLDEPCSALDPAGRREVLDLIGALRRDHTVLFCSHILDDVQEVCDAVAILRDGRLLFQGALPDLLVGAAAPAVKVCVRGETGVVADSLRDLPWVTRVQEEGAGRLHVTVTSAEEAERGLVPALARAHAAVVSIVPAGADLEHVFLELTT